MRLRLERGPDADADTCRGLCNALSPSKCKGAEKGMKSLCKFRFKVLAKLKNLEKLLC